MSLILYFAEQFKHNIVLCHVVLVTNYFIHLGTKAKVQNTRPCGNKNWTLCWVVFVQACVRKQKEGYFPSLLILH